MNYPQPIPNENPRIQLPIGTYNSLHIILASPSRFDKQRLLSGWAGDWFNDQLRPLNRLGCWITLADDGLSHPTGTKVCLLLGPKSLALAKPTGSLNQFRGSPFTLDRNPGVIYLPSYAPQDAVDRKDYFAKDDTDKESDTEVVDEKAYQKTSRSNWRFWLGQDLVKARRLLQTGIQVPPRFDYRVYQSADIICKQLLDLSNGNLYFDIETDRQRNVTVFSYAWLPANQMAPDEIVVTTVPFKKYDNQFAYPLLDCAKILRALAVAFQRNLVVCHNGAFDLFVMALKYKIPFPLQSYDTMLAHHRCYPEVEKSLGHCISLYTDLPFHKDEGVFEPKNQAAESQLWAYNAKDVYGTCLIHIGIRLTAARLLATKSIDQANASLRPYLTMSYLGMRANTPVMLDTFNKLEAKKEQYERLLRLCCRQALNPRSPKQVAAYLYDKIGCKKPAADLTGEDQLLKLYAQYGYPSLRIIIAAREASKLASSLKFKLWREDRITCQYKITGTETFRLGSAALFKFNSEKGWGTNTQNWSKKLRHIVIPDEGKILGQNDQSGAEALIVAYLCDNQRFRSLFLNRIKPHVYVALHLVPEHWASLLGVPSIQEYVTCPIPKLKDLPRWKELETHIKDSDNSPDSNRRYYYIAKTMCHSLNYDASWQMFQMMALIKSEGTLRLTDQQCRTYHELYRQRLFPEITQYHLDCQRMLSRNKNVLTNLMGYPRLFGDPWGRELFKQAYAFRPQSTVGTITNIAITRLQDRIDRLDPLVDGLDLLQNGHDSILWQCPIGREQDIGRIVKQELEQTLFNDKGESFKMGSECQVGFNWSPASDKNPDGLKEIKI